MAADALAERRDREGAGVTCLIVRCPFYDRDAKGMCPAHKDWALRILGDDRYRTEQPPECIVIGQGVQAVLTWA